MRFQGKNGKYRTLVVDDNAVCREIVTAALTNSGFMVDQAKDGLETITLCRQSGYDVIFMDIEMPQINGYQTTEKIKSMKSGSQGPYIIALTGKVKTQEEAKKCFSAGMSDIIVKPISKKVLQDKLMVWLKKRA